MTWFRLVNMDASAKKARIDIYDTIGEFTDWWTGEKSGVAAREFSATLQALGEVTDIELHINSPGGSVPDGIQIYNELKRHQAKVTVFIDGQAASIASIIAMAGDEVVMPQNTTMWVHDPSAWFAQAGYLNAKELKALAEKVVRNAEDLETVGELIINTYLTKANDRLDRNELKKMLEAETTITAEQAVAWGLADRIEDAVQQAASFDMSTVRASADASLKKLASQTPEQPAANQNKPNKPSEPPAMEARAVIAACKEAGFANLAPALIEQALSEPAVTQALKQARDIQDMAAAAGLEHAQDQLLNAAQSGPVEAMRVALSINMEASSGDIQNTLPGKTGSTKTPNFSNIYAQRNVDKKRHQKT